MNNKSQAALESLSTYGWAILVLLIVIGTMTYMSLSRTDEHIPSACIIESGIACMDFVVSTDGIVIKVKNNYDSKLGNIKVHFKGCGDATGPVEIEKTKTAIYEASCALPKGKFQEEIYFVYTNLDADALEHNITGQLSKTIK